VIRDDRGGDCGPGQKERIHRRSYRKQEGELT